jgi:uncharacterized protein YdaU (DUF1376 family)
MKKPAAIPLFGDAYLADTTHLTTEEHGAYLLMMIAAWRQGDCGLPMNDRKLARIAGLSTRKWKAIKATILEFWIERNGRIYQARLLKERHYVDQKSEQNRKNIGSRWKREPIENIEGDPYDPPNETDTPPPPPIKIPSPNGDGAIDLVKAIFDSGRKILAGTGVKDGQARSIIGRWRKTYSDGLVLIVLSRCEIERPEEPIEWITKALQFEARKARSETNGNQPAQPDRQGTRGIAENVAARLA